MSLAARCERCQRPLPAAASVGLCPVCLTELARAPWLDPHPDAGAVPSNPIDRESLPSSGAEHGGDGSSPTRSFPPQFKRFADFELLEEVARGGMGVVYKARQVSLDRTVAVKMIGAGVLASELEIARFRAEAEAAASLRHPRIVAVHGVGEHEGQHYFTMEWVEGGNLAERIREGPWAAARAAGCLRDLADAVEYAHRHGVLHRDLKPSNIVIDSEGLPHITDFGLARRAAQDPRLTQTGVVLGTPGYMSPEQAMGSRAAVSPRSDVYSLGAILYELLTSRPPFRAETPLETLALVRESLPVSPRLLNPRVPKDLETICLKCLEKDPGRRYSTARELAEDLGRFLAGDSILARPVGNLTKGVRWARRKPALAGLLGVTGFGSLAFLGFLVVVNWRIERQRADLAEANRRLREEQARMQVVLANESKALEAAKRANQALQEALSAEQRSTYIRGIALARQEWLANNLTRANQILEECGPEPLRGFEWRYLRRLCLGANAITREGHLVRQSTGAASHGLPLAVRQQGDRICAVWADSDEEVFCSSMTTNRTGWWPLASSSDGNLYAAGLNSPLNPGAENGGEIFVWNRRLRAKERVIPLPPGHQISSIALSPDGLSMAAGTSILVTNSRSGGFSESGAALQWWSLASGQLLHSISLAPGDIHLTAFTKDNRRLLASRSGGLGVWDVLTGAPLITVSNRQEGVIQAVAVAPDDRHAALLAGGGDGIQVVDLETGLETRSFPGHAGQLSSIAYSPDGKSFAAGSRSGTVYVWDVTTQQITANYRYAWGVAAIGFSRDGSQLIVGNGSAYREGRIAGQRSEYVLQALAKRQEVSQLHPGRGETWTVAFSPDGRSLVSTHDAGEAVLWDRTGAGAAVRLTGPGGTVYGAAFSPISDRIATAAADGRVRVWDRKTGKLLQGAKDHGSSAHTVAYSPDGTLIASAGSGGLVKVAHADSGQGVVEFTGHRNAEDSSSRISTTVVFSPDGREIASAGYDKCVRVWNATNGQERLVLTHQGRVYCVAYDHDGRRLASCSTVGEVKLWDPVSGKEVLNIRGHLKSVDSVAFSPDGRRLAVTSGDSVYLFDTVSGAQVLALPGGTKGVAFSPDGRTLAAGGAKGSILLWDASPTDHDEAFRKQTEILSDPASDPVRRTAALLERSRLFSRQGRKAEARRDFLQASIPARDRQAPTSLIDLSAHYNAALVEAWHLGGTTLGDLPVGRSRLSGVEFDIRGLIQVGSARRSDEDTGIADPFPTEVTGIPIGRRCARLHFLHAAINAYGNAVGTTIGRYVVHLADGRKQEIPIRVGIEVADWWNQPDEEGQPLTVAWKGHNERTRELGRWIRLFKTTWENPEPGVEVRELDFSTVSRQAVPFLVALTAE